jgi:hypothetical protein
VAGGAGVRALTVSRFTPKERALAISTRPIQWQHLEMDDDEVARRLAYVKHCEESQSKVVFYPSIHQRP